MKPERIYFNGSHQAHEDVRLQIAASGPDSPTATIMLSILKAISLAREEILITTPYFIPGEIITDALKVAFNSERRNYLLQWYPNLKIETEEPIQAA